MNIKNHTSFVGILLVTALIPLGIMAAGSALELPPPLPEMPPAMPGESHPPFMPEEGESHSPFMPGESHPSSMPGEGASHSPFMPGAAPELPPAMPGESHSPSMPNYERGMQNHGGQQPAKGHSVTSGINFKSEKKQIDENVINTVDVDSGGNWLLKRVWWEKTEDVYGQVKEAFNKVMTARMTFFSERNRIDKELDQFYLNIGIDQGPLQDILHFGLQAIEKEKKEQQFLNKKEQEFSKKIKEKNRIFEQLKKDVDAIEAVDQKIDEALDVVLKQIDICNKYEQQAWENFKNIARELNDKEARKQYYETKGLLEDINKVHTYLTGPFSQYFHQTVQAAEDHMKSIAAQMATLKKDGIDLKKEADSIEKEDEVLEAKQHKEHHDEKNAEKEKKDESIKKSKVGFFTRVIDSIKGFFSSIIDNVTSFYHSLFSSKGRKHDVEVIKKDVHRVVKEVEHDAHVVEQDLEEAVHNLPEEVKEIEKKIPEYMHEVEDYLDEHEEKDDEPHHDMHRLKEIFDKHVPEEHDDHYSEKAPITSSDNHMVAPPKHVVSPVQTHDAHPAEDKFLEAHALSGPPEVHSKEHAFPSLPPEKK